MDIDISDKYKKYKSKYIALKRMVSGVKELANSLDKSHAIVDVILDDNEKNLLNKIKLDNDINDLNYYGKFDKHRIMDILRNHIMSIGNEQLLSDQIANIMTQRIIQPFLISMANNSLWLKISVMFPTTDYETPRWHFDGYYYDPTNDRIQMKLAGTLYGPGTLFKKDNTDMRNKYFEMRKDLPPSKGDRTQETINRKIIATGLQSYENEQPSNNNQVVLFIVGDQKKAAIHSEPNITSKRLFFSVVPGNVNDIRDLAGRYGGVFEE